jgi:high-affinity iron transporter
MTAAFTTALLIGVREGLEAALIVGIICAYVAKVGRRDVVPWILTGVALAVGLSIGLGVAVVVTVGRLPLQLQATIEGMAAVLAVIVVTWMLFWMRRQGRAIKGELESSVATALAAGTISALVGIAFLAVIREGLETALFFLAILASESGDVTAAVIGGLVGLGIAVALGWSIFVMGRRVNLGRFFTITGVVLIFVAAGLVVYAVSEFTEAGFLPVQPALLDLSSVLPQSSPIGSVLAGLFGYRSSPSALQVVAYLLYLVPVLYLYVTDWRPSFRRVPASA